MWGAPGPSPDGPSRVGSHPGAGTSRCCDDQRWDGRSVSGLVDGPGVRRSCGAAAGRAAGAGSAAGKRSADEQAQDHDDDQEEGR
jgi:hypothetical protein